MKRWFWLGITFVFVLLVLVVLYFSVPIFRYVTVPVVGGVEAPDLQVFQEKAPENGIPEQGGWINSPPLDLEQLLKEKKVLLIDFWTYSCINCIRATPYTEELWKRYKNEGLVVIGVHSPEFQIERDPENVQAAVKRAGITYPVITDGNRKIWEAFDNYFWPAKYVINPEGKIVYTHFGEGGYEKEEEEIVTQLREAGWNPSSYPERTAFYHLSGKKTTPELYAGPAFLRKRFGNKQQPELGEVREFALPEKILPDRIYLEGKWLAFFDYIESLTEGAVRVDYLANTVYIVLAPPAKDQPVRVEVLMEGKPVPEEYRGKDIRIDQGKTYLIVDSARLYAPISDHAPYGHHSITFITPVGLRFYSLTFGAYSDE